MTALLFFIAIIGFFGFMFNSEKIFTRDQNIVQSGGSSGPPQKNDDELSFLDSNATFDSSIIQGHNLDLESDFDFL